MWSVSALVMVLLLCGGSGQFQVPETEAGYDYESQAWFAALTATAETRYLSAANFSGGTLRIREPGKYVLTEDVDFAPRPDLDYWPPFDDHDEYPMGAYFLGFFAAVTIETADVWLDLNGKTLQQSEIFYKKQRFFNVIELADKVFVEFEGVASLNYQLVVAGSRASRDAHHRRGRQRLPRDEEVRDLEGGGAGPRLQRHARPVLPQRHPRQRRAARRSEEPPRAGLGGGGHPTQRRGQRRHRRLPGRTQRQKRPRQGRTVDSSVVVERKALGVAVSCLKRRRRRRRPSSLQDSRDSRTNDAGRTPALRS